MEASIAKRRLGPTLLTVPEPDLTPEELIARAAALKPLLRQQQPENDERGCYSEELHQAFLRAGLYRTLQPRMFGGYEFDVPTFYKAMLEITDARRPAGAWRCARPTPSSSPRIGRNRHSAICLDPRATSRRRTACRQTACSRPSMAVSG